MVLSVDQNQSFNRQIYFLRIIAMPFQIPYVHDYSISDDFQESSTEFPMNKNCTGFAS